MASKKRSGLALLMEQLEAAETKLASKKAKLDVEVKEVNRQKEELRNAVIAKAAEDGIDPKFVVETKFGRRSLSATPTTVVSASTRSSSSSSSSGSRSRRRSERCWQTRTWSTSPSSKGRGTGVRFEPSQSRSSTACRGSRRSRRRAR